MTDTQDYKNKVKKKGDSVLYIKQKKSYAFSLVTFDKKKKNSYI